ncbi:MAG: 5-formyltetrahydrofolate cyclo-ligase [Acetobacteraceae bacterium]|nr:5-formyltetrahydrofolate cyclo-ligase [Acetobacteraceae bacterium]
MRLRRAGLDPAQGVRLAGHLLRARLIPPGAIVSGFWPLPGEIDARPALLALNALGHRTALPVTPAIGQPLSFRCWRPGCPLRPGRFGTFEPEGEPLVPTVLLVPLLAFDRSGARLGYGGGFYDRTLARAAPGTLAIGCAYALQEVARVATETHDHPLHAIATELGVIVVE